MLAKPLRILLIGNGGREHTLAWKLSQSPLVETIHVVPGNGGTATVSKCQNIADISQDDFPVLAQHAKDNNLNYLVPGPEAPLVAGIVDYFNEHTSLKSFGPLKAAAMMEGSKTFSKDFMRRHSIPTARYANFSNYDAALKHLNDVSYRCVIKADGLAAGKGVIIPETMEEARQALTEIMLNKEFGDAGDSVVIEEYLEGNEISILSLTDGATILSLPPAQDHKRIGEGDTGPNTGGMGTYAPTPLATQEQLAEIERTVLQPTIDGMRADGISFQGCLFTGFMLTNAGPRVLEYNVRFGDPESQSCLTLLESDLAELMVACSNGTLARHKLSIAPQSACTVVIAAAGYPGSYKKGTPMHVQSPDDTSVHLFHAGTTRSSNGQLKTSGGRVIAVTARAQTLREAVDKAYANIHLVSFDGMQYRKDIAHRVLR